MNTSITSLNNVIKDERFQVRAEVCPEHIKQLALSILEDGQQTTLKVWRIDDAPALKPDGTPIPQYWLVDGFHRWNALDSIRKEHGQNVNAKIEIVGTGADVYAAKRYAIQANSEHVLAKPRTNADKQNACTEAVDVLLNTGSNVWRIEYKEVATMACVSEAMAKKAVAGINKSLKVKRDIAIDELEAEGKTQTEIAEQLGLSRQVVHVNLSKKDTVSNFDKEAEPTVKPEVPPTAKPEAPEVNLFTNSFREALTPVLPQLKTNPELYADLKTTHSLMGHILETFKPEA
ncbi:hypothetical protein [Endozoicomonas euniceicola]|uniref:ParB/Sulfiredoxin domain-containing protein n=1 Tax=Endozoicomonas euniceicola TaxID=1234143 RepID=A0ABY6GPS9_9GAMM|nr:hypothetical protein [Endozoicomonas euniceicola]UYM14752.1 hypothetical protein NX720_17915 [Endozoicomonas euniceicola]